MVDFSLPSTSSAEGVLPEAKSSAIGRGKTSQVAPQQSKSDDFDLVTQAHSSAPKPVRQLDASSTVLSSSSSVRVKIADSIVVPTSKIPKVAVRDKRKGKKLTKAPVIQPRRKAESTVSKPKNERKRDRAVGLRLLIEMPLKRLLLSPSKGIDSSFKTLSVSRGAHFAVLA